MNSCYSNRVTEQAKNQNLKDDRQKFLLNYLSFYFLLFAFCFLLFTF